MGMFIDGFAPWISIHAPHEGERPPLSYLSGQRTYFNPRSPRGGATMSADDIRELEDIFQSTLPTRGSDATPWPTCAAEHRKFQSTLPTRGSDPVMRSKASLPDRFQSTLPTRGSDEAAQSMKGSILYFNPRSPRGGATCYARLRMARGRIISIHAPHEGERLFHVVSSCLFYNFNPRSPRGGATRYAIRNKATLLISIHAPHEGERPYLRPRAKTSNTYFNPRSPRGGATWPRRLAENSMYLFQSTLPTRGSDSAYHSIDNVVRHFNPRSPRGGATDAVTYTPQTLTISIHAPHEGERR